MRGRGGKGRERRPGFRLLAGCTLWRGRSRGEREGGGSGAGGTGKEGWWGLTREGWSERAEGGRETSRSLGHYEGDWGLISRGRARWAKTERAQWSRDHQTNNTVPTQNGASCCAPFFFFFFLVAVGAAAVVVRLDVDAALLDRGSPPSGYRTLAALRRIPASRDGALIRGARRSGPSGTSSWAQDSDEDRGSRADPL
ncbi:hypothetical protein KM043_009224 [Ampulex compressa]|nr:hypothetical protein KM043_009224 [Ampulex compressa]